MLSRVFFFFFFFSTLIICIQYDVVRPAAEYTKNAFEPTKMTLSVSETLKSYWENSNYTSYYERCAWGEMASEDILLPEDLQTHKHSTVVKTQQIEFF